MYHIYINCIKDYIHAIIKFKIIHLVSFFILDIQRSYYHSVGKGSFSFQQIVLNNAFQCSHFISNSGYSSRKVFFTDRGVTICIQICLYYTQHTPAWEGNVRWVTTKPAKAVHLHTEEWNPLMLQLNLGLIMWSKHVFYRSIAHKFSRTITLSYCSQYHVQTG